LISHDLRKVCDATFLGTRIYSQLQCTRLFNQRLSTLLQRRFLRRTQRKSQKRKKRAEHPRAFLTSTTGSAGSVKSATRMRRFTQEPT
ncbi:hypothetical protein, partial [Paraburkholderia hospita]|uniref:hypothetical protein n=1 Tax=Paraburkholderia hospita TaxID=169430 RepID=UPI001A99C7B2